MCPVMTCEQAVLKRVKKASRDLQERIEKTTRSDALKRDKNFYDVLTNTKQELQRPHKKGHHNYRILQNHVSFFLTDFYTYYSCFFFL
jgi:hypothetical protein